MILNAWVVTAYNSTTKKVVLHGVCDNEIDAHKIRNAAVTLDGGSFAVSINEIAGYDVMIPGGLTAANLVTVALN